MQNVATLETLQTELHVTNFENGCANRFQEWAK